MVLLEFYGVVVLERNSSELAHSSTKVPRAERTEKAEYGYSCLTTISEENPRWLILQIDASLCAKGLLPYMIKKKKKLTNCPFRSRAFS